MTAIISAPAEALLEAKFQQYNELFLIQEGESVIMCFKPTKAVTWDYVVGELNEPQQRQYFGWSMSLAIFVRAHGRSIH